ncbi:MAG TPA: xanthine dehydrogenase family protein subunit M [Gemmatimonadaceae bacterium]|jgi:carbon-monoxide dehydrogenase medium subunit
MYPAPFEYTAPATIDEALALLAEHGENAKLLAGGHSLLPLMKLRFAQPTHVVDLRRIPSLRGIRRESGSLIIGAMTTYNELATSADIRDAAPIVADAASQIGDPQVRNRGTIGGSLAHADPAADLPAVILALGATIVAVGRAGRRTIHADAFFRELFATALDPEELLAEIRIPVSTARSGSAYAKHPHPASRFALVGVAATVDLERMSDRIQRVRVAVTGFGTTPLRAIRVEEVLAGRTADPDTIAVAAMELDAGAQGGDAYKVQLARVCADAALRRAAERAR